MKRMLLIVSFIILSIVLAGCISIPVGDNVLNISTNGIDFVGKAEEKDLADSETSNDSDEVEQESNVEEVQAEIVTDEKSDNDSNVINSVNDCVEDHSAVTEDLHEGFYIPDCAELTNVSKDSNHIKANFILEGDWLEVFNTYKDYLGDELHSEKQNPASGNGELRAHLYEDTGAYTRIKVNQGDESVTLEIIQYFSEE